MMWTKTEQALPKKTGEYLVATLNYGNEKQYRTLNFDGERFVTKDGRPWMGVVQWMPIPDDNARLCKWKRIVVGSVAVLALVVATCYVGE